MRGREGWRRCAAGWSSRLLPLLMTACAVALPPAEPLPAGLLDDRRFAAPSERIETAAEVFALNDAMREYLKTEIAAQMRAKGRQQALVDALYGRSQLRLDYDTSVTRNAAQAFDARSGNCLSLALMTAAFAKALDLELRYQSATVDETWLRSESLVLRSGHVNVTLGRRLMDAGTRRELSPLTIDFLPASELRGLRTREIDESIVVAMYQNNRAVEALVRGRVDDAYWWARAALASSPAFAAAINTLGVVYLRHGEPALAERAFRGVLAREPAHAEALANLAQSLARQPGRDAEAAAIRRELARLEPQPPFHFLQLGREAMQRGEYAAAREWLLREAARSDYHEVHFWLAVAEHRLGHLDTARRHLSIAMRNSTTRRDQELYAAKLARLRAVADADGAPDDGRAAPTR